MLSEFIITFRETLEAALIIGIILAYLLKTKRVKYNNIVYIGVGSAVVASIIGAFLFNILVGGFTGRNEGIFEGIAMLVAMVLITFMIIWMLKQKYVIADLNKKVEKEISEQHKAGLFLLVFISVFREGIETVIFLNAASFVSTTGNSFVGGILGICTALILGYIMFVWSRRINIKAFFNITSIILILFAAGLTAHGVHEFQEADIVPILNEHVFDINPEAPLADDGVYPVLHENGTIGSIAKSLFGYNGNPSFLEILSYAVYLILVVILWRKVSTKK